MSSKALSGRGVEMKQIELSCCLDCRLEGEMLAGLPSFSAWVIAEARQKGDLIDTFREWSRVSSMNLSRIICELRRFVQVIFDDIFRTLSKVILCCTRSDFQLSAR